MFRTAKAELKAGVFSDVAFAETSLKIVAENSH